MELKKMPFPAPDGVREFQEITIREVNGLDENQAGFLAAMKTKKQGRDWSPTIELIKLSVVSYVDSEGTTQTPSQPFDELDRWTSRARNAVTTFFNTMNGLDDQDLKACVAAATAAAAKGVKPTKTTTQTQDETPTEDPNGG